jgi:hypothetical protein
MSQRVSALWLLAGLIPLVWGCGSSPTDSTAAPDGAEGARFSAVRADGTAPPPSATETQASSEVPRSNALTARSTTDDPATADPTTDEPATDDSASGDSAAPITEGDGHADDESAHHDPQIELASGDAAGEGGSTLETDADSPDPTVEGSAADVSLANASSPGVEPGPLEINADEALAGAPDKVLFRGWPKPQVTLVLSGEQDGYIEPCGCAGKENQKGGLSRRHTLFKDLTKRGWELVPLDMGGLVRRYGRQTEIKFHTTVDGLRKLKYQAIGFGPGDLKLPEGELISDAAEFVSANVGLLGLDSGLVAKSKVIEAGGRKIGVTAILGRDMWKEVNNESLEFVEAADALAEVVPQLKEQGCDFLVLLSHAKKEESQELARAFPDFNVVLTAGGASEPPSEPATIEGGDALLVEVGHKGMYVACLGLYDDPDQPVRFQLVPLDSRFADSTDMRQLMAAYQGQLEELGLAGLEVRAVAHPSGHQFVGSARCGECHTQAHGVWAGTTHAHALDTLKNLDPPRYHDPECLSCHVTGWEPQRFVPFAGGYLSIDKTPLLQHNGCENCHGPGSAHAAAESGESPATGAQRDALRAGMRLTLDQADRKCSECHDLDNSPEYVAKGFEHFWPHVEHHGKD